MSAGTRRNGSSKFGPSSTRIAPGHHGSSDRGHRSFTSARPGRDAYAPDDQDASDEITAAWYLAEAPEYGWGVTRNEDDSFDGTAAYGRDASDGETAASNPDARHGETAAFDLVATWEADAAYDEGNTYDGDASHGITVAWAADAEDARNTDDPARRSTGKRTRYSGRHAGPRRKSARDRARKAVPAAVVAAAFAAGAVGYTLLGSSHPQAAQLSQAMSGPLVLGRTGHTGTGQADSAASAMIQAARAAGTARQQSTAKPTASPRSSASTAGAAPAAAASSTATPAARVTPTASASPSAPATLSCNLSYGLLPANVTAIVSFLLAHGYTDNAAAGIAGNIYQESKGDPESVGMGGGGLIGWTPLPSGFITGNPAADLQTQLSAILTYNQEWASYIPALNSATSPSDAAYIYVTDFERAGIPAAATRETAAADVASACGI